MVLGRDDRASLRVGSVTATTTAETTATRIRTSVLIATVLEGTRDATVDRRAVGVSAKRGSVTETTTVGTAGTKTRHSAVSRRDSGRRDRGISERRHRLECLMQQRNGGHVQHIFNERLMLVQSNFHHFWTVGQEGIK